MANQVTSIVEVHIERLLISDIGKEGLIVVAKCCPKLQELVLIGVNPTILSLEMLGSYCSNLEHLALCGSDIIGDPQVYCIAAKCVALKKLCIKNCHVSDVILERVSQFSKIKSIYVCGHEADQAKQANFLGQDNFLTKPDLTRALGAWTWALGVGHGMGVGAGRRTGCWAHEARCWAQDQARSIILGMGVDVGQLGVA
ncbi:unnamed protein product [Lupinus luteus]|uniref:Uncharacterized protein n=1 Tax=Lupinus luteus TaxID=3873 RepID=A0AAV1YIJ5_LUPLU